MKVASLILNIVLLLAIIPLYIFHFSDEGSSLLGGGEVDKAGMGGAAASKVAYINTDTLFQNYNFYEDISADYQEKREKVQKQLETRTKKLENKLVGFQRRAQAGLMTRNEISAAEQELAQEQQDLQTYQQTVSAGLLEEERALNERLFDRITVYLEDYNQQKGYDIIFSYNKGNNIWLAEDALNITQDVLQGLNDQYKAEGTTAESTTSGGSEAQ